MPKRPAFEKLNALMGDQAIAVRPDAQIWLSASAGAGKTHVLTARVLRLLLRGASPESILCLTFTKAGAAEMADRVHERLSAWVTLPEADLRKDLHALGEAHFDQRRIEEARRLFARVLDARGGGLRIQTIHSFAQTLLASFPAEAELPIGFRPIEGRDEALLLKEALADLITQAEREGQQAALDRFAYLARTLGEDATRSFLKRCADAPDAMADLGPAIDVKVRRWLGIAGLDVPAMVQQRCADDGFDKDALDMVCKIHLAAGSARFDGYAQSIQDWCALDDKERAKKIPMLLKGWAKDDGEIRESAGFVPKDDRFLPLVRPLHAHFMRLQTVLQHEDLAQHLTPCLMVGQEYARVYQDAKRTAGVVDFGDMIRATVRLLKTPGIGDWISYKLDQSVDHILVDEAQDTNADQWAIIDALSSEFFAGEGAKPGERRTIFAVGDFKQAIFGFQGTNPQEFERAREHFSDLASAAGQEFEQLTISESFRSSQPILDVVDAVIASLGSPALGLEEIAPRHKSFNGGAGHVELWPAIMVPEENEAEGDAAGDAEENWFSSSELEWAATLAEKVRHWTQGGLYLHSKGRTAEPGDIMILLRARSSLARLIVSRLYEEKVPVAGVDRLQLDAPIAVQDLMACIRFVLQPADDLTLASLLVSPLIGWSQDMLFERSFGRAGHLWPHLRDTCTREELDPLFQMLAMADRVTPYGFLETILSGPLQGRTKMIARLGEEARDPIEELLNAALLFEAQNTPSLQLFLDWFCASKAEIKRDPAKPENAVRVMTVHGAKGLQAPIVVLADATADPTNQKSADLVWAPEPDVRLPIPRPKKEKLIGQLQENAARQDERDRHEHWRLLYVAMTRAEEMLFIGGALKKRQSQKGEAAALSWYKQLETALVSVEANRDDAGNLVFARHDPARRSPQKKPFDRQTALVPVPDWALAAAPEEARPARPLAPSSLGVDDQASSPPPDPAMRDAARRGTLLHALFERLPAVPGKDRRVVALRWLESQNALDPAELVDAALAVIENPDFADVFAPAALAEAPLAGVVNGQVIAGIVDRLLVTDTNVVVIDFKTGRRVPRGAASVPDYYKAQMAAYVSVLEGIFPDRLVSAALLYTAAPRLLTLSPEELARFRPGLGPDK